MEDRNKILAEKVQENTDEVRCRDRFKSDIPGPLVGDADDVSKSSFVSSCEKTRRNALSSTSTTANNTERKYIKKMEKPGRRDNEQRDKGSGRK